MSFSLPPNAMSPVSMASSPTWELGFVSICRFTSVFGLAVSTEKLTFTCSEEQSRKRKKGRERERERREGGRERIQGSDPVVRLSRLHRETRVHLEQGTNPQEEREREKD